MEILDILNINWGIDGIMKKIRPQAKFRLENKKFTKWEDPTGSEPPTWDKIINEIEKEKKWHISQK